MNKTILPNSLNRLFPVLVLAGVALVYFIFLPVSYSFDGTVFSHFLRYALIKHDVLKMVQVQHVLYFPVNYLIYRSLEFLFHYRVLEFFHLQLFSMCFAVMTLVLLERMLKKAGLILAMRLIAVAVIAFSYAFWLFAVDAEVHMAGVFFVAAGLYLLLFRESMSYPLVWPALCFALAAGFHLTNILIVVTVVFYLLEKRASWSRTLQFFLAYFIFMMLLYGVFAALSHKPVLNVFYNMLFGSDIYSGNKSSYLRALTLPTVLSSLMAVKHALIRNAGIWSWPVVAGFLALLALACKPKAPSIQRTFQRVMVFWFLPFFLFFLFWDANNIEFKIHVLVPLQLIAVIALGRMKPVIGHVLGATLAISLLLVNLFFGIRPQADIERSINYQVALAIQRATPLRAQIVITGNFHGYGYGKIHIPYFALREVMILDWLLGKGYSLPRIHARLQKAAASGQPLYALGEIAVMGQSLKKMLASHQIKESDYDEFKSGMRFIPAAELPGGYRLYRLEFATRQK